MYPQVLLWMVINHCSVDTLPRTHECISHFWLVRMWLVESLSVCIYIYTALAFTAQYLKRTLRCRYTCWVATILVSKHLNWISIPLQCFSDASIYFYLCLFLYTMFLNSKYLQCIYTVSQEFILFENCLTECIHLYFSVASVFKSIKW